MLIWSWTDNCFYRDHTLSYCSILGSRPTTDLSHHNRAHTGHNRRNRLFKVFCLFAAHCNLYSRKLVHNHRTNSTRPVLIIYLYFLVFCWRNAVNLRYFDCIIRPCLQLSFVLEFYTFLSATSPVCLSSRPIFHQKSRCIWSHSTTSYLYNLD